MTKRALLPHALSSVLVGCLAAQTQWEHVRHIPGTVDQSYATAFDSARGRLVLVDFHFLPNSASVQETWEWDNSGWELVARQPFLLREPSLAYDPVRQRTVMFGGYNSSGLSNETYLWDGSSWSLATSSGPSARVDHAMTWDSSTNRVLMHGGATGTHSATAWFRDLWAWDGSVWQQLSTSGPVRSQHSLAYDDQRSRLVLFGGRNGGGESQVYDQTWEWDGTTWIPHIQVTVAPSARTHASFCYDPTIGKTVLFGGRTQVSSQLFDMWDAWTWNGNQWTQISGIGFDVGQTSLHWDPQNQRRLLVTGMETGSRPRVWTESGNPWPAPAWAPLSDEPPPALPDTRLAYDVSRSRTVMFGGGEYSNIHPGTTWEWDGSGWRVAATSGPAGTIQHAMVYDSTAAVTLLFGGRTSMSQTWTWDGSIWSQHAVPGPTAYIDCMMAHDSARGRTVLFGGATGVTTPAFAETWEWDGGTWQQIQVAGPPARTRGMMAFDPIRSRTVLHGGTTTSTPYSWQLVYLFDTWEWDGATWQNKTPPGVQPGPIGNMAFDHGLGEIVKMDGTSTWSWNGTNWTLLDTIPVSHHYLRIDPLQSPGDMVYDQAGQAMLQVGPREYPFDGPSFTLTRAQLQHPTYPSTAVPFGQGCGSPPLTAVQDPAAPPILGSAATLDLNNVPTPFAVVHAGSNDHVFNGFSLPVTLAAVGMPGCDLLQSMNIGSFQATAAAGNTATWTINLPQAAGLIGVELFLQAFAVAPGANQLGVIASNGVQWVFGTS